MPCYGVKIGKATGIVCTKRRRKRCRWCTAFSTRECDGKLAAGGTCDAPMCPGHGVALGQQVIDGRPDTVDLCPDCVMAKLRGHAR